MGDGLGLVAALHSECRAILTWEGWRCMDRHAHLSLYEREEKGKRIRLVVSGVGGERARVGLEALLDGFRPQRVISFGYGGGLDPALRPGDLVLGKKVLLWEAKESEVTRVRSLLLPPEKILDQFAPAVPYRQGFLVSVNEFVKKDVLRRKIGPGFLPAAVEMETSALSHALEIAKDPISLVGFRAISDELSFEITAFLQNIVDETSQVRGGLLMRELFRRPGDLRLLVGLYRRSRIATRSLAIAMRLILQHW